MFVSVFIQLDFIVIIVIETDPFPFAYFADMRYTATELFLDLVQRGLPVLDAGQGLEGLLMVLG